jgi:hypothetical protein
MIHGSASLQTSHFAGPNGNHEASPVRKRVHSPYLMYIYYKFLNTTEEKKRELRKLKLQQPIMATSDKVLLKHVHIPSVRLFFAGQPTQLESCFV